MNFAGTPATTENGATFLVTMLPAPITAPLPTVTFPNIVTCSPIQTSLPIVHVVIV